MMLWIILLAVIVIFLAFVFWQMSKGVSEALADIRHGKGVLLTFNYTPEEWEHYTQTLPFNGQTGKVCFARHHIYISDGAEEILYEIYRLRKISIEKGFVVFTVRIENLSPNESGKFTPDNPDNLKEYQIPIPNAQQHQTDELFSFYQKVIDNYDQEQQEMLNQ